MYWEMCTLVTNHNATHNVIGLFLSWRSFLLVGETGVHGDWQTLTHDIVSSTPYGIRNLNFSLIGTDYIGNCKSIYHMITTTPEPYNFSDFIMNYILHTKHYFDLSFMDKIYVMSYL